MGKIKKYQPGGFIKGNVPKGVKVDTSKVIKGMNKIMNPKKKDVDLSAPGKEMMEQLKKKGAMPPSKKNIGRKGIKVKAKNGKSFPDLNKDGKITKADILKGRGVIKNGRSLKKARGGATLSPSGSNVSKRLSSYPKTIGKAMNGTTTPMQRRARVAAAIGRGAASRRKSRTTAQMPTMNMGGKCRGGCY